MRYEEPPYDLIRQVLGEEHWQAEITRTVCPFMWGVHLTKGIMGFREEWPVFGTRKRAQAVARRRLRRQERADRRAQDKTIITGGGNGW